MNRMWFGALLLMRMASGLALVGVASWAGNERSSREERQPWAVEELAWAPQDLGLYVIASDRPACGAAPSRCALWFLDLISSSSRVIATPRSFVRSVHASSSLGMLAAVHTDSTLPCSFWSGDAQIGVYREGEGWDLLDAGRGEFGTLRWSPQGRVISFTYVPPIREPGGAAKDTPDRLAQGLWAYDVIAHQLWQVSRPGRGMPGAHETDMLFGVVSGWDPDRVCPSAPRRAHGRTAEQ